MKSAKLNDTPQGYRSFATSCGIKDSTLDLGVIVSDVPAQAASIFTKNKICGEPLKIGKKHVENGTLQSLVVNSKNSNVATGPSGYQSSLNICKKIADELNIDVENVFPSSTGVIGKPLPFEKIVYALDNLQGKLCSPADFALFAEAIMTTDTFPKYVSAKVGNTVLLGVAKGSGMIEPNMATMLAYFFTDAKIGHDDLQSILKRVADKTFNSLSVDSDTSTSDTCCIMANGVAGSVDLTEFENVFQSLALRLTRMIARDGEGATKLFIVNVINAENNEDAKKIAKSIINSPLVKTMIYQGDPNWGRIYMAIGKTADVKIIPDKINIYWASDRSIDQFSDLKLLSNYLINNEEQVLTVDMGIGDGSYTVYGCDLTEEYVKINAYYTT